MWVLINNSSSWINISMKNRCAIEKKQQLREGCLMSKSKLLILLMLVFRKSDASNWRILPKKTEKLNCYKNSSFKRNNKDNQLMRSFKPFTKCLNQPTEELNQNWILNKKILSTLHTLMNTSSAKSSKPNWWRAFWICRFSNNFKKEKTLSKTRKMHCKKRKTTQLGLQLKRRLKDKPN